MTTLRVIVDDIVAPAHPGVSSYAEELTRALIIEAPAGCDVAGIVSASPATDYQTLELLLPGLAGLQKSSLARRELRTVWQHGLGGQTRAGLIHSPSLLAPLRRHDRLNSEEQTVVTVHDTIAWTSPDSLSSAEVRWRKAMVKRAHRYADAVVVPTHAVADQLDEIHRFGERIRVIGKAVSSKLILPVDPPARAERLKLPDHYVLAMGARAGHKGLRSLLVAMARPELAHVPLLVTGDVDMNTLATEAGLDLSRVRTLGRLEPADLAVAFDRATVFAFPSLAEGFGLPVLEAFRFGTPVVHSDDPAVLEVSAGAGMAVERGEAAEYPGRLAEAIASVLSDRDLAEGLRVQGLDRERLFNWQDSAEKIWQLHADL